MKRTSFDLHPTEYAALKRLAGDQSVGPYLRTLIRKEAKAQGQWTLEDELVIRQEQFQQIAESKAELEAMLEATKLQWQMQADPVLSTMLQVYLDQGKSLVEAVTLIETISNNLGVTN